MSARRGPVVLDRDGEAPDPSAAPPVDGPETPQPGRALRMTARLGAARSSAAARLLWSSVAGLVGLALAVAAYRFVAGLFQQSPLLGTVAVALLCVAGVTLLVLMLREAVALTRLRRLDAIRRMAVGARDAHDLPDARRATERLSRLYRGRVTLRWGVARFEERAHEAADVEALLSLAEAELVAPLDAEARREVEAAARQVAGITALVPLALADVAAALFVNLRMIRRVAEIYGGHSGLIGGWRLARAVLTHLVATGAMDMSEDLIGSVAGGGLLSKVSRRAGEGIVNGALTARVGVAAIDVCRPLPYCEARAPRASQIVRSALSGLFDRD